MGESADAASIAATSSDAGTQGHPGMHEARPEPSQACGSRTRPPAAGSLPMSSAQSNNPFRNEPHPVGSTRLSNVTVIPVGVPDMTRDSVAAVIYLAIQRKRASCRGVDD